MMQTISRLIPVRKTRNMPLLFSQMPTPDPSLTHAPSDGNPLAGAIIGAIGAVLAATLGPPVAAWLKARAEKREKQFAAGLADTVAVMDALIGFQACGADRMILWTGHNGGGLPSSSSPFFVSALHRIVPDDQADLTSNYQGLSVDRHYIKMLLRAMSDSGRTVVNTTEKMPDCQLKSYYEAEGVSESLIIILGVAHDKLYYLSLARYEGHYSEKEKTIAELKAQTLAQKIIGVTK